MKFSDVSTAALAMFALCATNVMAHEQHTYSSPDHAAYSHSAPPAYLPYQAQAATSPIQQSDLPAVALTAPVTEAAPATNQAPFPVSSTPAYYSLNPTPVPPHETPVHTAPPYIYSQATPYAAPVTAYPQAQPHAVPVQAAPSYIPSGQVMAYTVMPPHAFPVAIAPAPQMAQAPVKKLSKREREEGIKRCNFADDSIGHALNGYAQLLHKQLPYDSAKYYENQMHVQTYNLRNHIRSIKHTGHSEICEQESHMALQIIQSIYQYR